MPASPTGQPRAVWLGAAPGSVETMPEPQQQTPPGTTGDMTPQPDHGEQSYRGSGRLQGKAHADHRRRQRHRPRRRDRLRPRGRRRGDRLPRRGRGRARDGALGRGGRPAGGARPRRPDRPGGLPRARRAHRATSSAGIDVLVNNAAFQMSHESIEEIPRRGVGPHDRHQPLRPLPPRQGRAPAHGARARRSSAPPRSTPTTPSRTSALRGDQGGDRELHGLGWRSCWPTAASACNSVAPGPVWTPLIPATMPPENVESFGSRLPMQRPAQPAELAPVYVHARLRRGELRVRRARRRHGRQPDPLRPRRARTVSQTVLARARVR